MAADNPPEIRHTPWQWILLVGGGANVTMLLILTLALGWSYYSGGDPSEQKAEAILCVFFAMATLSFLTLCVFAFLQFTRIERVVLTPLGCASGKAFGQGPFIPWCDIVRIDCSTFRNQLKLDTGSETVCVHNVFKDPHSAVTWIFAAIPANAERTESARLLEQDPYDSSPRHPFYFVPDFFFIYPNCYRRRMAARQVRYQPKREGYINDEVIPVRIKKEPLPWITLNTIVAFGLCLVLVLLFEFLAGISSDSTLRMSLGLAGCVLTAGSLFYYLLLRRCWEQVTFTQSYCETLALTGRRTRLRWNNVDRVSARLWDRSITLRAGNQQVCIHNVLFDANTVIPWVFAQISGQAQREELASMLEGDSELRSRFLRGGLSAAMVRAKIRTLVQN